MLLQSIDRLQVYRLVSLSRSQAPPFRVG